MTKHNFPSKAAKRPFTELAEGGKFNGSQPWTVLLREAVALAGVPA